MWKCGSVEFRRLVGGSGVVRYLLRGGYVLLVEFILNSWIIDRWFLFRNSNKRHELVRLR